MDERFTNIKIDRRTHRRLRRLAEAKGGTMSGQVRLLVSREYHRLVELGEILDTVEEKQPADAVRSYTG